MIDYWCLFATSLDPNDGLGTSRKFSAVLTYAYDFLSPPGPVWPQYTPEDKV